MNPDVSDVNVAILNTCIVLQKQCSHPSERQQRQISIVSVHVTEAIPS